MEAHRVAAQLGLIGPTVEQPQYHLLERNKMENEYLMIFKTVGLGTTIWSPLASGLLTGKYNNGVPEGSRMAIAGFDWLADKTLTEEKLNKVKKLKAVADKLGTSLAVLGVSWCIKNSNVTTAILGATKKEQLTENLKALDFYPKLSEELMNEIENIIQTKPVLPEY